VHQQLRGSVIELLGAHGLDEAKIIEMLLEMGQAVRDPMPALSGLMEGILGSEKLGHSADESEALSGEERSRAVVTIEPGQLWLIVEKFQLTRRASHVQIDHSSDFCRKLGRQFRQWTGGIAREIERFPFGRHSRSFCKFRR
jgi:hypothetical protein